MTEIEEKNYKAQIELYEGIRDADNMIIHTIQNAAMGILKKIIEPKMFFENDQKVVELTTDEFTELRVLLARLSSDEGFEQLNGWIAKNYLAPKSEKLKILSILK
jgi:hypothetical protein